MNEANKPVFQALFVTFLWSTSWILIKLTINNIPPLYFAGMRYFIAFLVLFVLVHSRKRTRRLDKRALLWISIYGIVMIALTQGSQFVALKVLPTVMVSLALNATPIVVAIVGYFIFKETLKGLQKVGMLLYVVGVVLYFYPFQKLDELWIGIGVAVLAIIFNSTATLLGRYVNQQNFTTSSHLTMISMGVGSIILLGVAYMNEPFFRLGIMDILVLVWLGVVNTAFAFTLWNNALQKISATSASLINSTMLIQIAMLSWIFLNETLALQQIFAVMFVFMGVVTVQIVKNGQIKRNSN